MPKPSKHDRYYSATKTTKPLEPLDISANQRGRVNSSSGNYDAAQNGGIPSMDWITENK